jgi:tetratricopeptide (TPR) repeat protein
VSTGLGQRSTLVAAALLLASACGGATEPRAIPLPALHDVEKEVVEAITAAHAAVRREPESGKAWGRLGDHYFVHDFTAQAAQCYARAEELDPESYLWPYRRGICLQKDHPELAVAPFERTLRSLENYAPAQRAYADVLVRLGRSDEAVAHFTRAAELDRADPEALTALGRIYLGREDLEGARKALEEALSRNERYVEAHVTLSQVCLALGMEKKAQRHAELSRTLPQVKRAADAFATPNLPPAGARGRTRYGQELEHQEKPAEALEQYRAALASNPDYYLARRNLANLLVAQGKRDEAIELLRDGERRNPTFERVRKDLARLLEAGEGLEGGDEIDE